MSRYEVVISGISGGFAGNLDVDGLEERIYNTQDNDLITLDSKGFFKNGHSDKAEFIGDTDAQLDGTAFGIHGQILMSMDGSLKAALEKTYEAITDAGIPAVTLKGQNIATVASMFNNESEMQVLRGNSNRYSVLILNRGMVANRISYTYDFTGESYTIDSGWVGGLAALDAGARLVATGMAKAALVLSTNIIIRPESGDHLGVDGLCFTSPDGKTRSFSHNANGFARSEAVVALFLQRKEDALRSYGTIEMSHVSTTMQTEKEKLFIGTDMKSFLKDCYQDIKFDPEDIAYLEADGIAVKERDREELEAVIEAIASRRKSRLPVSCCKSRLGHAGGTAGLVSLVHCLLAGRQGFVPPTLDYDSHHDPNHPANHPKIQVVSEKVPLQGDLLAVNTFGFTHIGAHVVIRRNGKTRSESDTLSESDPPALILISGRVQEEMTNVLKKLSATCKDRGYIGLLHKAFRKTNPSHTLRGFAILNSSVPTVPRVEACDMAEKPPIWLLFSGMGSQWNRMGKDLLRLPILAASLLRCHDALIPKGLDLISILTSEDPDVFEDITNSFVSIAAIQIALVDLLTTLGLKADGIIGHSVGEVGCGYADGCLTAQQAILCAYARGRASKEATLIKGMMAAVGRGYADIKDNLPDGVEVACHNSSTSCTISGPVELVNNYVEELKQKGVFAKAVNVSNIAYHSKYIQPAGPLLLKYMKEIIVEPVERSKKWVCSSVEESRWEESRLCSAEFYTNNLLSAVLFEEAARHIPEEALLIEVAPHGLLQAIVKRSHPKCLHVPLTSRTSPDNLVYLLEAIGRVFTYGLDMDISRIYPEFQFPVPRETKSIGGLVTWHHNENSKQRILRVKKSVQRMMTQETLVSNDGDNATIFENYIIRGKPSFPTSFILDKVREIMKRSKNLPEKTTFQFESVRVHSQLEINETRDNTANITIFDSGEFFVADALNTSIITGFCVRYETPIDNLIAECKADLKDLSLITQDEVYHMLEECGYQIKASSRLIKSVEICSDGFIAEISLEGEFKDLMESALLAVLFFTYFYSGQICDLESIKFITMKNITSFESSFGKKKSISVQYSVASGSLSCDKLFISGVQFRFPMSFDGQQTFSETTFTPFTSAHKIDLPIFFQMISQLMHQQMSNEDKKLIFVELNEIRVISTYMNEIINQYSKPEERKTMSLNELFSLVQLQDDNQVYVIPYLGNVIPDEIIRVCDRRSDIYVLLLTESGSNESFVGFSSLMDRQLDHCRALLMNKAQRLVINKEDIHLVSGSNLGNTIKKKINSATTQCYIVSNLKNYSIIIDFWQKKLDTHQKKNTKFVFLDDTCPPFDSQSSFYMNQLQKGLRINVCKGSNWGYILQMPTDITAQENNNEVLINTVRSNVITVEGLSANRLEETNSSVQIVDFQGTVKGKRVMGVATLDENELHLDPILQWECPSSWSTEQACTVPVAYSMAYYLMVMIAKPAKGEEMVLVEPDGPLGDAIIRLAFHIGVRLTLVLKSHEQKQTTMRRLPQLHEEDILVYERNKLLLELEKRNKNGYQLIINGSLDPSTFFVLSRISAILNIKQAGCNQYIQISKEPLEGNLQLGLEAFNNGSSLMSCFPEKLVALAEDEKVELRAAVEKGLKEGVVEPLQYKRLYTPVTSQQLLQAKHELSDQSKLVITFRSEEKGTPKLTPKETSILIIGEGDSIYSLLYWLSTQTSKKIIVFVENNSSSHFSNRLKILKKKLPGLKLELYPASKLQSVKSSESLLRKLQKEQHIVSAFIFTEGLAETTLDTVNKEVMEELNKDCNLYLVGGESVETRRQFTRLVVKNASSTRIVHAVAKLYRNQVSEGEFHLSQTTSRLKGDVSYRGKCMPQNLVELVDYGYSLSSEPASFVQASTKSSLSSLDATPVFVIPGFRVTKLNAVVSKLYCTAYTARMPSSLPDIDTLVDHLKQDLDERFKQDVYTFVCEGWTQIVAMRLSKLLEEDSKICQIIVLDANIVQIQKHLTNLSTTGTISKYIQMSEKVYNELRQGSHHSPSNCIDFALRHSLQTDFDVRLIKSSLMSIIDTASLVCKVNLESIKNNAYVTYIQSRVNKLQQAPEIEQICRRQVSVSFIEQEDVFSFDQLATAICDLKFQEYPGLAKRQNFDRQHKICYFGKHMIKIAGKSIEDSG